LLINNINYREDFIMIKVSENAMLNDSLLRLREALDLNNIDMASFYINLLYSMNYKEEANELLEEYGYHMHS